MPTAASTAARRAAIKAARPIAQVVARLKGKWISPALRLAIYIRDGFVCQCCGRDLRHAYDTGMGWTITLDHLKLWADGGSDEPSNLVTCCRKCNDRRGTKPWTKFYPPGAHVRVRNAVRRAVNVNFAAALIKGRAK